MIQLLVEGGEPERNIERAIKFIRDAHANGCELAILPETLDFAWTHPSALTEAQPIPGKFSDIFSVLAAELKIWLCLGLTEKRSDKNYNTAIVINHEGELVLKYSKINLLEVEFPFYEIGNKLEVINSPFGKIGVNICADNYMESGLHCAHMLARMGAELILSPSSWTVDHSITEEMNPYHEKWVKPLLCIAKTYNVPFISVTSIGYIVGGPYEGKKMVGCSLAVNETGILAQGEFNEFASDLKIVEINIKPQLKKGVQF